MLSLRLLVVAHIFQTLIQVLVVLIVFLFTDFRRDVVFRPQRFLFENKTTKMRAYAVVMVTSLYHRKNGSSVLFSVRKADQEYLSEYHVGAFFYSFAISLLARIFRSSALTESLAQASLNRAWNRISRT